MANTDSFDPDKNDSLKKDNKLVIVNAALFGPSEWDDYPLKRDDKHTNKIVQPDFAPFCDINHPEPLPDKFSFVNCNLSDEIFLKKICAFLNTKSDSSLFIFDPKHLKWVLDVPVHNFPRGDDVKNGCVFCVMTGDTIAGFIAARPITYRIDGRVVYSLEVIWMCTLPELRGKRLAAVMMKELYRRAYKWGVSTGITFTLPRQLPALHTVGPIRLLRKILDNPDDPITPNKNIDLVRFANMRDVSRMMKNYRIYASDHETMAWRLHREYNKREFEHTFLKRGDVMTYVIRTERGDVKDFVSLYELTEKTSQKRVAYIHFISYASDKILELFLQNVLYVIASNKFHAVYIADIGAVGETLRSKLHFQDAPTDPGFMYHFNFNTTSINPSQLQISPTF